MDRTDADTDDGNLNFTPNQTCLNCKFWKSISISLGDCRRFPPTVVTSTDSETEGEHGEYREIIRSTTSTQWPDTSADDWCGEFQKND